MERDDEHENPEADPMRPAGGPVLPDVLTLASSVWVTEPRSRSEVNRSPYVVRSGGHALHLREPIRRVRGEPRRVTPGVGLILVRTCCSAQSLTAAKGSLHLQRRSKRVGYVPAIVVAQ